MDEFTSAAARAEALAWLKNRLDWERLLSDLQAFADAEDQRRSEAA